MTDLHIRALRLRATCDNLCAEWGKAPSSERIVTTSRILDDVRAQIAGMHQTLTKERDLIASGAVPIANEADRLAAIQGRDLALAQLEIVRAKANKPLAQAVVFLAQLIVQQAGSAENERGTI
jgi:hypothetical protein